MESTPFLALTPACFILIVDDVPDSGFLLERDLRLAMPNASIRRSNSRSASQLLSSLQPDLLVTTYRLEGTTGPELIAHLREAGGCYPILMVSSVSFYRSQALEAGANFFLTYENVRQFGAQLSIPAAPRLSADNSNRAA